MPEPDAAKRFLARRRVLTAAVALVVVLAVSGFVFGIFEQNTSAPVKISFVSASSILGEASSMAMFSLSNTTARSGAVALDLYGDNFPIFRYSGPTNDLVMAKSLSHNYWVDLPPRTATVVSFELPHDGRTGHLELKYVEARRQLPDLLDLVRSLCQSLGAARRSQVWVRSEEEIQGPLVRPDGTVEPARLVPKGDGKGR